MLSLVVRVENQTGSPFLVVVAAADAVLQHQNQ